MRATTFATAATALVLGASQSAVVAAPPPLTIIAVQAQGLADYTQELFASLHLPSLGDFREKVRELTYEAEAGAQHVKHEVTQMDVCPDLSVSCVNKDGKTVGKLGKKPFCWNRDDDSLLTKVQDQLDLAEENGWYNVEKRGNKHHRYHNKAVGCAQCEPTKNDAECNVRYVKECVAQCESISRLSIMVYGPLKQSAAESSHSSPTLSARL